MASKTTEELKPLALIVDDERSICESLSGVLSDEGWKSVSAYSGKDGIKKFIKELPDLVLLDVWMSGMDGIETLQRMKALQKDIPIVIMSGHGSIETAVKATKFGAFDYLEKPLSLEKLLPMLDHALAIKSQKRETVEQNTTSEHELVGNSKVIEQIKQQIMLAAPRNAWILITGENGTGKEVLAHQIHLASSRAKYPFVAINCAAIPEELIESELFGHEKGAFTNAIAQKKGKFELANKGTLFLDEIADMSLRTQAKILRILQEQKFERVGGKDTIDVDVRVIAATNKNLEEEIANARFRDDLYYRLNVVPFHLPPLRERNGDIELLAEHFLEVFSKTLGEDKKSFTPEALGLLNTYPWPGNVRELRNLIERLCIMIPSNIIDVENIPDHLQQQQMTVTSGGFNFKDTSTLKQARVDFERTFILEKLQENDWNVSKTADAIGIERSNLHRKLKAYDIDPKQLKG